MKNSITITLLLALALAGCDSGSSGGKRHDSAAFISTLRTTQPRRVAVFAPGEPFNPSLNLYPTEGELWGMLQELRGRGYEWLISHSSERGMGSIPRLAKKAGFHLVLCGVYDIVDTPATDDDWSGAIQARKWADAYVVDVGGPTFGQIKMAVEDLISMTGRPVTASFEIEAYFDGYMGAPPSEVVGLGDFLSPKLNPLYHDPGGAHTSPKNAWSWAEDRLWDLTDQATSMGFQGKPILANEFGYPSSGTFVGHVYTEAEQEDAIGLSMESPFTVGLFESFDQPWKDPNQPSWGSWSEPDAHFGLQYSDGTPKPALNHITTYPGIGWLEVPTYMVGRDMFSGSLKGQVFNVQSPELFDVILYRMEDDGSWHFVDAWPSTFIPTQSGVFRAKLTSTRTILVEAYLVDGGTLPHPDPEIKPKCLARGQAYIWPE